MRSLILDRFRHLLACLRLLIPFAAWIVLPLLVLAARGRGTWWAYPLLAMGILQLWLLYSLFREGLFTYHPPQYMNMDEEPSQSR